MIIIGRRLQVKLVSKDGRRKQLFLKKEDIRKEVIILGIKRVI